MRQWHVNSFVIGAVPTLLGVRYSPTFPYARVFYNLESENFFMREFFFTEFAFTAAVSLAHWQSYRGAYGTLRRVSDTVLSDILL